MDALYLRVGSNRQSVENQFDELVTAARAELARGVVAETRTTHRGATRTVYQVDEVIARRLADYCFYVQARFRWIPGASLTRHRKRTVMRATALGRSGG